MRRWIYFSLLTLLFLSGCAYFNTFYNARQYYKKGYEATQKNITNKPTGTEMTNYEKAIDKSLKLIVEYPNSNYVDDALLLAGKAYYYRQDYFKARRKFLELITNYPNSELITEGKLWMARTHFALDEFEEAEIMIHDLVNRESPKRIKGQAYFYLGKFYERNRNFEYAADAYHKALDFGLTDQKANAWFSLGASLDTLGRFEEASQAFKKVSDATRVVELEFEGDFRYAESLKKAGNSPEALRRFETLLGDEKYVRSVPRIKIQVADCLYRNQEADEAISYYDEITIDHERTKESAQAYYEMGMIYENHFSNLDRALDNYMQVKKEFTQSIYADTAEVLGRDIQRLNALMYVVGMGMRGETGGTLEVETREIEEDSLTIEHCYDMMDAASGDSARYALLVEIGGKVFADSVQEEKNKTIAQRERDEARRISRGGAQELPVDWRKWLEEGKMPSFSDLEPEFNRLQKRLKEMEDPFMANNPELTTFKVEALDRNLFLLAELYRFRFNAPDSAFTRYEYLVREFPESPYAPRALFNMADMYASYYQLPEQARPIYEQLANEYSRFQTGRRAREMLGLPAMPTRKDTVTALFSAAESLLLEQNAPDSALSAYAHIFQQYGDSEFAPKALYAKGWIYEHKLDSLMQALAVYDSLIAWFPESPFAEKVQSKVKTTHTTLADAGKDSTEALPDFPDGVLAVVADSLGRDSLTPADGTAHGETAAAESAETPEELAHRQRVLQTIPENLDLMARRRRIMRLEKKIPDPEAMNR